MTVEFNTFYIWSAVKCEVHCIPQEEDALTEITSAWTEAPDGFHPDDLFITTLMRKAAVLSTAECDHLKYPQCQELCVASCLLFVVKNHSEFLLCLPGVAQREKNSHLYLADKM